MKYGTSISDQSHMYHDDLVMMDVDSLQTYQYDVLSDVSPQTPAIEVISTGKASRKQSTHSVTVAHKAPDLYKPPQRFAPSLSDGSVAFESEQEQAIQKHDIRDALEISEFCFSFYQHFCEIIKGSDPKPKTPLSGGSSKNSSMESLDYIDVEAVAAKLNHQPDEKYEMPSFADVWAAIHEHESTAVFRLLVSYLLKPLITSSYTRSSFTSIISEVDSATNDGKNTRLKLFVGLVVDVMSASHILRMYFLDNYNLLRDYSVSLEMKDVFLEIQEIFKNSFKEVKSEPPRQPRKRQKTDSIDSDTDDDTLETADSSKDYILKLTPKHRMILLKFLSIQLLDLDSTSTYLDAAMHRIPELRRQVKRENQLTRNMRKDIVTANRHITTLHAQINEVMEKVALNREEEVIDLSAETDMLQRILYFKRQLSDSEKHHNELLAQLNRSVLVDEEGDSFTAADATYHTAVHNANLKSMEQMMGVRNLSCGRDRDGSEYWVYQSVPGLFVYSNEGVFRVYGLEEFEKLLASLDDLETSDELALHNSLDSIRPLVVARELDNAESQLVTVQADGYEAAFEDVKRSLSSMSQVLLAPFVNHPRKYAQLKSADVECFEILESLSFREAFPTLCNAVIKWLQAMSELELNDAEQVLAKTTVKGKRRKKTAAESLIPHSHLSAMYIRLLMKSGGNSKKQDELGDVKPMMLKPLDRAFTNFRGLLQDCVDIYSLRILCRLLETAILNAGSQKLT